MAAFMLRGNKNAAKMAEFSALPDQLAETIPPSHGMVWPLI
jgi:hypothetical protein